MSHANPSARHGAPDGEALEIGRAYSRWFMDGALESVWERLAPDLRGAFGDVAGLRHFRERVAEAGKETRVVDEIVTPWLGLHVYSRVSEFTSAPGRVLQQWMLDTDGIATGFLVEPAQAPLPSTNLDYQTRTPLYLPVAGEWFVFWGGRDPVENRHAVTPDQRFAYDLLIVRDARTHAADPPTDNRQFYSFGEPIISPGVGTVVSMENGVPDNVPGSMNAMQPLGNNVVIDHGNGEFSFLAHLQEGTVSAKVGDQVAVGDVVGRCGNSGNSSEPHIHYHLQDSPHFGKGLGLPAQFLDYFADDVRLARGEPTRGHFIRSARTR